jgi:uncharacterized SAM-binding protein YcdF (DUF218 family)
MPILLRHFLGSLATPLMIAFLLSAAAAFCRVRGRRRSAAWLLIGAAAIVYLGSLSPVGEGLLAPLESQYPPLSAAAPLQSIGNIVVLGSGYMPRDAIPITAALDADGLARIVEGLRLARRVPGVRLVVSGGAAPGYTPGALGYAELAHDFGVANESLVVLQSPLDTEAEARAIAALLGGAPFVLVTSAYHMPRAMRLLESAGQHPIPAATGQRVGALPGRGWHRWLPTSAGMHDTELALHEYLGLAALAIGIS